MFLKKNNLLFALAAGIFFPILTAAIVMLILEQIIRLGGGEGSANPVVRPRTVYLIGICINVLLINYYKKLRYDQSMRGIVIATSILGLIWIIRFGSEIMDQIQ